MAPRKNGNDTTPAPTTAGEPVRAAAGKAPASGAAAAIAAVREGIYPVTVTRAELDEALADQSLTDDERTELRHMARQNDVIVSDR